MCSEEDEAAMIDAMEVSTLGDIVRIVFWGLKTLKPVTETEQSVTIWKDSER